jgi:ornithine carbamoyltransferase
MESGLVLIATSELTSDVMDDSKYSVVFDQAENRLHAQKGIMALIV